MQELIPWLTPALIITVFGWLRADMRNQQTNVEKRLDEMKADVNKRFEDVNKQFGEVNKRFDDVNKQFSEVNKRFDQLKDDLGKNRERMAKVEGALEAVLAASGRRNQDAA